MPNDTDASDHTRNCGGNYRIPADFLDGPPDPDEPPFGPFPADFQKSFEIAIQLGAIASVIVLYWRRFLELAVVSRVLVAFLPTGLIGLALYRVVKTYLFDSDVVVLWALGLGGVALIVFELLHREGDDAVADVSSISYAKAFLIGVFQSLSMVPGVSRGRSHDPRRIVSGTKSHHDSGVFVPSRRTDNDCRHRLRPAS
jgi:Bacitracin resistance protein BacA